MFPEPSHRFRKHYDRPFVWRHVRRHWQGRAILIIELLEERYVPTRLVTLDFPDYTHSLLLTFDSSDPTGNLVTVPIQGLVSGDEMSALDVRPTDGQLYGLGVIPRNTADPNSKFTMFHLYSITIPAAGPAQAQPIGPGFGIMFTPDQFGDNLLPGEFNIAFVPGMSQLRVVSAAGDNFLIDANLGSFIKMDTPFLGGNGDLGGGGLEAITYLDFGQPSATLYGIAHEQLVMYPNPSQGSSQLSGGNYLIGPDNNPIYATQFGGLDAIGNGQAYAVLESSGTHLYFLPNISNPAQPNYLRALYENSQSNGAPTFSHLTALTPVLSISVANTNTGSASFIVTRSGDTDAHVTVNFATSDGTAKNGIDYTGMTGTLDFSPNVNTQQITINLLNNGGNGGTFSVILSGANNAATGALQPNTGAVVAPQLTTATVTIKPASKAPTTTTVVSPSTASVFGQSVSFNATVSANSGAGTPTGTVSFLDGSTPLGQATLGSNGKASFTTSRLTVGNHVITASYLGDNAFAGSVSTALPQAVGKASTSTILSPSVSSPVAYQSVTFTAVVSVLSPGGGIPTGTILFTVDGTLFS
jgi:hypothetical protein